MVVLLYSYKKNKFVWVAMFSITLHPQLLEANKSASIKNMCNSRVIIL